MAEEATREEKISPPTYTQPRPRSKEAAAKGSIRAPRAAEEGPAASRTADRAFSRGNDHRRARRNLRVSSRRSLGGASRATGANTKAAMDFFPRSEVLRMCQCIYKVDRPIQRSCVFLSKLVVNATASMSRQGPRGREGQSTRRRRVAAAWRAVGRSRVARRPSLFTLHCTSTCALHQFLTLLVGRLGSRQSQLEVAQYHPALPPHRKTSSFAGRASWHGNP